MTDRSLTRGLLVLPGVGVSLIPKLLCPACWSAFTVLLSAVGLGFLVSTTYLFALTVLCLAVALASLALRTSGTGGRGSLGLGVAATAVILVGSFYLESLWVSYVGVGLLISASVWSVWPRQASVASCSACLPAGDDIPRQESRKGQI